MKGVRFFLEYDSKTEKNKGTRKKPGKHNGNVLAVYHETGYQGSTGWTYEGTGAVNYHPNSAVGTTGVTPDYLRDKCKRISEKMAREIHPQLFNWLDA